MNGLAGKQYLLPVSMLAAAAMLLGTAWVGDDAFITLRVIDNFVNGYGLRYNVIERVQVFTHPLWFFFLTPFYALTREALVTTMLVSVILSLGALWLLATRIARNAEYGCLLILAAVAARAICHYSTSGLESPLTFFLLSLFVWQLERSEKMWVPAGIAGLLLFNRLDLVVLIGPVMAYLLLRARGAVRVQAAAAFIFPALAWMIFSVIYYGAPFPNTAYAKLGTGYGTGTQILHGLEYTRDFVTTNTLLALIMAAAVYAAARTRNGLVRLQGAGIVLYLAYVIVIGGDFMSGRFFAVPGFFALCVLAQLPAPQWFIARGKRVLSVSFGILGILLIARMMETEQHSNAVGDEQRSYYSNNGLFPVLRSWVTTGHEPVHPLAQLGMELKATAQRFGQPIVVVKGADGMSGFYGGPAVHILDPFALADAFLARLPAVPGARVGHYQRILPPGYIQTVFNPSPATRMEVLRPLLDDVILATRAPLFAEGRWSAIWRLLSGRYRWIYGSDLYGAGK